MKAAYIAICLLADEPFERVVNYAEYINDKFTQPELMAVKYLRKVDSEAYAYMIKVVDEMPAILSDRNRIMQKKELERVKVKWNEYMNERWTEEM